MSDNGFRVISRTVRKDEFGMRVGQVTIAAPDGSQRQRTYLHSPDVVAIVAVRGSELVLVREFRASVGTRVLSVPMGKIPEGTHPRTQAIAELAEETGLAAGACQIVASLLSCPGWMNQVMHVFLATDLAPLERRPDTDDPQDIEEHEIETVLLPVSQLPQAIASGRLCDARSIAAIHIALVCHATA